MVAYRAIVLAVTSLHAKLKSAKQRNQRTVTTDERIDAIAMHLEITARMVEDNEKRAAERSREIDRKFDKVLGIFAETGRTMTRLANIAEAHEQRIEDLEGH